MWKGDEGMMERGVRGGTVWKGEVGVMERGVRGGTVWKGMQKWG